MDVSRPIRRSVPRAQRNVDLELADEIANYYADPLGFVACAYPWGEPGVLRDAEGPDTWQRDFLEELVGSMRYLMGTNAGSG